MEKMFNRSFILLFSKKKILVTSSTLFLCSLLFLFLQTFSFWGFFFAYFISLFFLIPLGILLCQGYTKELQGKVFSWRKQLLLLGERLLSKSLWAFFFVLTSVALSVGFVFFQFFQSIPFLQEIVSSLLFLIPFALVCACFFLFFLSLFLLFWAVPLWAFHKEGTKRSLSKWLLLFKKSPFLYLAFPVAGMIPFSFLFILFRKILFFTQGFLRMDLTFLGGLVQGILLCAISSFFLSFGIIFFFHLAVEAFYFQKKS